MHRSRLRLQNNNSDIKERRKASKSTLKVVHINSLALHDNSHNSFRLRMDCSWSLTWLLKSAVVLKKWVNIFYSWVNWQWNIYTATSMHSALPLWCVLHIHIQVVVVAKIHLLMHLPSNAVRVNPLNVTLECHCLVH